MVITAAQLHPTNSKARFCAASNPAGSVSEICDGEDLCLNQEIPHLLKYI